MFRNLFTPRRIYLDHAATTPMDVGVFHALTSTLKHFPANPGGLHADALAARELLGTARKRVARCVAMQPSDVVFTRGGTESDILALWGIIQAHRDAVEGVPHVIISSVEHSAVRENVYAWEEQGIITVSELPVNQQGVVDAHDLKKALTPQTILVSVMYVNNEIGSVQPIRELAKTIRWWRKHNETAYPYFHTDAIQATNLQDMHMPRLGVDLMSISGSKIYGPKSIGALVTKPNVILTPLMHGGSQEFDMRPGTEDVAACVAFAYALEQAIEKRELEHERLRILRNTTLDLLAQTGLVYRIYGDNKNGSPHIISIGIPHTTGERLVIEFDARGISVASRAACATDATGQTHVIAALGISEKDSGTIRVSMGRSTREKDMVRFVSALRDIMQKIRQEHELIKGTSQ
jgi:cysteine desulfurase